MILAKKNRILAVLMTVAVVTGLTSCLKNNSNVQPDINGYAFFANLATPSYKVTLWRDNTDLLRGEGLEFTRQSAGAVNPGPAKIDIKRLGSDTLLTSTNITLDTLRFVSFFIHGTQTHGIKMHTIREDFSDLSTSKANIRFYNMVADSEPVDFWIGETKISSSRMYEDFMGGYYDSFMAVEPSSSAEIIVKKADGTELTRKTVDLGVTGGVYSIFYAGEEGNTGDRKPAIIGYRY